MLFVACLTTATSLKSLTILTRIAICLFVAIMFGDDICRFGVVGRVRIKGLTSFDDAIFESQGLMIRSSTIKPTAILEEGADRNLLVIAKICEIVTSRAFPAEFVFCRVLPERFICQEVGIASCVSRLIYQISITFSNRLYVCSLSSISTE